MSEMGNIIHVMDILLTYLCFNRAAGTIVALGRRDVMRKVRGLVWKVRSDLSEMATGTLSPINRV